MGLVWLVWLVWDRLGLVCWLGLVWLVGASSVGWG